MIRQSVFLGVTVILILILMSGCKETDQPRFTGEPNEVKLLTLDPGHFHAYLVQKNMYEQVDPKVHVYAPVGPEVNGYLSMIENYNTRAENPTSWELNVYTGSDYLEKMLSEKKGNVVVLAGNNRLKTAYIKQSVDAGFNVLSDKPMAINAENFELLKEAFASAESNNVLLYDIMTERYAITSILQKEIMQLPLVFGTLDNGSHDDPSVIKESVHHFFKYVSGQILRRPSWFFDVSQQGEGIIDVTTHLVDLVQWASFPGRIIDYEKDVELLSATRWPTAITRSQFSSITGEPEFPSYLNNYVEHDTLLQVYANGEINYRLNGVHSRVIVKWNYRAPEGTGDTHYSFSRGSKARLIILQGAEQNFKPVLYIEPTDPSTIDQFGEVLASEFRKIQQKFPGVELKGLPGKWEVVVPPVYDVGHEAHFAQVTAKYLQFLKEGKLPEWEVPNMLAKYYITTSALEMAKLAE
jgi:hypothetical protein